MYIVSTYYHTLISCVKQLTFPINADILVTSYISGARQLCKKLKESALFRKVIFINNISEYEAKNFFDYIFFYHQKNAMQIESQIENIFYDYDDIYVFHDDIWVTRYLKDRKIRYHLIEDALNCYKNISQSKFSYMLMKTLWIHLKKVFNIGYVFLGLSNCIIDIEVNDKKDIEIIKTAKCKIIECPRKELFKKLDDGMKQKLKDIFLKNIPPLRSKQIAMLLTEPLFSDGYIDSVEQQVELYRVIAEKYISTDELLVIKPHPRDSVDYKKIFKNAIILDKNMPVEILDLCLNLKVKKIISVSSTAFYSLDSNEYISVSLDEIFNEKGEIICLR